MRSLIFSDIVESYNDRNVQGGNNVNYKNTADQKTCCLEEQLQEMRQGISQMDDRVRRTENMKRMLLQSLGNSSSPLDVEDFELER